MLFNSFAFLVFFPLVCLLYFLLPFKYRWAFLLVASYYFYMNWKPVYAVLIFTSTFITYGVALLIERFSEKPKWKRAFLTLSIVINIGILFLYKYFNFLNESVAAIFNGLNIGWTVPNLDLLLPVGISFYTFQAVGYTIDVYRGDLKAERHLGIYALFVSFFPQLVAGPIERARNLLPQFRIKYDIDYDRIASGLRYMLWGYFMKLVVADRVSSYVDAVYNNVPQHSGPSLLLATFLFAVQIYCDFAGYSYIAIGAAKVMGFNLMENFRRPYFARSVGEFWHRWHISLSTWFKDYVYIPLGGNRVGWTRYLFNLFVTFLVSGMWHGANWTFVIWGALHGFYSVAGVVWKRITSRSNSPTLTLSGWKRFAGYAADVGLNLVLVVFAWIFFRANSAADAVEIIRKMVTLQGALFVDLTTLVYAFLGISILILKEVAEELNVAGADVKKLNRQPNRRIRMALYLVLTSLILLFGVFDGGQFIYFQF